jgi:hypothetical protein
MVSILSAKTKLQISKTKDPIAREYTIKQLNGWYYFFLQDFHTRIE